MRLSPAYAALTLSLLAIEVCIALYVHDDFVRPYVGDTLVVILSYALLRTFFAWPAGRVLLDLHAARWRCYDLAPCSQAQ